MRGWGIQDQQGWRKGPWTPQEDKLLIEYVNMHGEGRWSSVARGSGLNRTGKSCRLRWVNYLRPGLKRGQITPQEEGIIIELHALWGNKWSTIARYLPGRTDNEIKNYWRTHFKKKQTQSTKKQKSQILKQMQLKQDGHDHHDHYHHQQEKVEASSEAKETSSEQSHQAHQVQDHQDVACWWDSLGDFLEYGSWGGLWNLDDHQFNDHHSHLSAMNHGINKLATQHNHAVASNYCGGDSNKQQRAFENQSSYNKTISFGGGDYINNLYHFQGFSF